MSEFDYDLFVIGGGSGGVRAARVAADHGARVAITEEYRYGGTCVIRGCVPKKFMVYAAHFSEDFDDAESYGWSSEKHTFDWNVLIQNKDKEIDRLNSIYIKLLENAGVDLFHEHGKIVASNSVQIGEKTFTANTILVATGGTPFVPSFSGSEHTITSNEAFHLDKLPERIIVTGGGYIAVEFAGIFNGLGCQTELVYRGEQILRGFDQDVRDHLSKELVKKGIGIRLNETIESIELTSKATRKVTYTSGETSIADQVMYATGRTPNTENIGVESVDIALGQSGEIIVDKYSRTNINNVYAVGDVTNRIALTPVATMEGHCFADTVFGNNERIADHREVASAVFSQPQVGTVGLTEHEARAEYSNTQTYRSEFRSLKHSLTNNTERTLMKLIVDGDSDRVLGAHMVGADAAEILQGIAIAIRAGACKSDFDRTVGIHPSSAEEFVTMRTPVT
ncbi:MAG: glutathione-disulfide reductase [Proteobacteria bacterium]|jgi:glutathione reductase (NADPH)|nr:glutathione-disulfide reductase [Pseudomonadota bacterium]